MGSFSGKTLMITGGTGSFGEAVLKRFLDTDIGEIRIFSRDEKKQDDMRHRYQTDKIKYYIGDVRDLSSVKNAIRSPFFVVFSDAEVMIPATVARALSAGSASSPTSPPTSPAASARSFRTSLRFRMRR